MNLYVGNLSNEVTNEDLQIAFAEYGEISSAKVIKDKFSNLSRGFGFVEITNNNEADTAIKALNGELLKGNKMQISEARTKKEKRHGRGKGNYPGGNRRY